MAHKEITEHWELMLVTQPKSNFRCKVTISKENHTAIDSEEYACPSLLQTLGFPNGLCFSLQIAGMIMINI